LNCAQLALSLLQNSNHDIRMRKCIYIIPLIILSLLSAKAQKPFIVVLDPGHGGKDPGCVGAISKEKDINLSVTLQLGELIEKNYKDVKVIYTRKTDKFIALDERANIANRNKADLFISIHVNAAKRGNASGTETYAIGLASSAENLDVAMRENSAILMEDDYKQKYEGFDPNSTESYIIFELMNNKHLEQSLLLASLIEKSFVRSKRESRGVRQAGFLVLRKTSMASVLIEMGFLSNRTEERFLVTDNGKTTIARSIYRAFADYKYDYDRKKGNMASITDIQPIPSTIFSEDFEEEVIVTEEFLPPIISQNTSDKEKKEEILYKIQILTSDKKIPVNDKRFKGYKEISFYLDKGIYKYTYGSTSDYRKIQNMLVKATKDFKGAFIIRMKDGERIN